MSNFHFDVNLSILNHLGRNLYRNFITVIGEAISNSWDACANNVFIYIGENYLIVLDDGIGMNEEDFQGKFLNIGYSKRVELGNKSGCNRPFIGRKGIGKLALLSCAQKIHILSKKEGNIVIGGIIDNSALDEKIKDNLTTEQYPLEMIDEKLFSQHPKAGKLESGTMVFFETLNEGIKSNMDVIRKLIALHFRFSLIEPSFSIFVNDEIISFKDIKDLSQSTQFIWVLNNFKDEYFTELLNLKEGENLENDLDINGFIASVQLPKYLNIYGAGEKAGIDLFVNGRLRESNILKNMPGFSTRHIASYLYGQIHINDLDDQEDRFTSSREGIKPGDDKYKIYLEEIEKILSKVSKRWDEWRKKHKETWDIENGEMPKFQALMQQSKNSREKDFEEKLDELNIEPEIKESLKEKLRQQSSNNTSLYQDLFILENLFREFLKIKGLTFEDIEEASKSDKEIKGCLDSITQMKGRRGIQEELHELGGKIVKEEHFLNFADFEYLGVLVDFVRKSKHTRHKPQTMLGEAKNITPIRNPVMHTNEISDEVMNWEKINKVINFVEKLANEN